MDDRALEQAHDIPALLALLDELEDRIQSLEVAGDDLRRVLGTYIHARTGQIALGEHFLRDERLVGQRIVAVETVHTKGREAKRGYGQPVLLCQRLPPGSD